jgi:RNA polymerase sigma-70 factor (ECF subfamily)
MDHEQEKTLIDRARKGDRSAMDQLLAEHQDRVFRTALGLLGGNEDAACEVAQEVLVSAFRNISQFRGDARFSTWLYRMCVNYSKNWQSSDGRRRARFVSMDSGRSDPEEDDPRPMDFAAQGPSARELAAGTELGELLQHNLARLPEEFREVLVLRYIEDASYEEIAAALNTPLGTIKSRINRARSELRKLMADLLREGRGAER